MDPRSDDRDTKRCLKNSLTISNTTNITVKILSEINQEMDTESRRTALCNKATVDYLLLKHNLGCQQFSGLCCMNVSDFSHAINGQIDNPHKDINKISQ